MHPLNLSYNYICLQDSLTHGKMTNLATLYNCHPCNWWTCHYTTRNGKMTNWLISTTILTNIHQLINRVQQNPKLEPEEFYRWQHSPRMFVLFGLGHLLLQHHLHLLILSFTMAEILSSPVAFISFTNSSEFPKSAFVMLYVCVCVCMYKCINFAAMEWKNLRKFLPTSGIYFRKFFPCLIAWIFTLRYWPFQDTQKLTPRSK